MEEDIRSVHVLPRVELAGGLDPEVERFAGIVPVLSEEEIGSDERLERIWNR